MAFPMTTPQVPMYGMVSVNTRTPGSVFTHKHTLTVTHLPPGSPPDGSDGRGASDGSTANDVQPACS